MADPEQLALLKRGVEIWNAWRAHHTHVAIDLTGADLVGVNLQGAHLNHAQLDGADLTKARLFGAQLAGAKLNAARLVDTDLGWADLTGASLLTADVSGADLNSAQLTGANVAHIRWDRLRMHGKYHGVRGLDSCYGNAIFRRDAADQDYLDTLELHWHGRHWMLLLFRAWRLIDYGRSIKNVFMLATILILFFGLIFYVNPGLIEFPICNGLPAGQCNPGFSAFYFSITTYMTLGLGDAHPKTHLGEIIVACEVTLGYLTLGLLLAVLADKVARRS